jgi:hypothetical protein
MRQHIPTNKGMIKLVSDPFNIFQNILILEVNWFEKDHTDSEHHQRNLTIPLTEYGMIQEEKLIGKNVEFQLNDDGEAIIVCPNKIYSPEEVKVLIVKAWNEGYDSGYKRLTYPLCGSPADFWRTNKK